MLLRWPEVLKTDFDTYWLLHEFRYGKVAITCTWVLLLFCAVLEQFIVFISNVFA